MFFLSFWPLTNALNSDIDLKPVENLCTDNQLTIRANQTLHGPYCGFGSMFDYTDTLTVDQFEVPAPVDGNLPTTLFEWTAFEVAPILSHQLQFY